ncbi:hypothetical protein [Streptomyces mirabilis]
MSTPEAIPRLLPHHIITTPARLALCGHLNRQPRLDFVGGADFEQSWESK